jgi:hypothetical protein
VFAGVVRGSRGSVRIQYDSPGQPTRFSGATKKVLACSHGRSLRLLCTVGGDQARLDACTEYKILERSLKGGVKLVVNITVLKCDFSIFW